MHSESSTKSSSSRSWRRWKYSHHLGLSLAAVPLQQLRKQAPGLVPLAADRGVVGDAVGETTLEGGEFGIVRHALFRQLRLGRWAARDRAAALLGVTAPCFEPGLQAD